MLNLYYFTDSVLAAGYINKLKSHNVNHANFKLTSIPNYLEIETLRVKKNLETNGYFICRNNYSI